MTAYVAFLRAVNVGGKNSVPMARLRDALGSARAGGGRDGAAERQRRLSLAEVLEGRREARRGDDRGDLRPADRGRDPLGGGARRGRRRTTPSSTRSPSRDPKTLHVAFFSARPTAAAIAKLDPDRSPPDAFAVHGREVYLSYPNGSGRSRLTLDYLETDARRQGHRAQLAHGAAARDAARLD